jgi:hypothetical protein
VNKLLIERARSQIQGRFEGEISSSFFFHHQKEVNDDVSKWVSEKNLSCHVRRVSMNSSCAVWRYLQCIQMNESHSSHWSRKSPHWNYLIPRHFYCAHFCSFIALTHSLFSIIFVPQFPSHFRAGRIFTIKCWRIATPCWIMYEISAMLIFCVRERKENDKILREHVREFWENGRERERE